MHSTFLNPHNDIINRNHLNKNHEIKLMRLVKYLTLAIPMSRNQAKFFIKRRRVTIDGKVQIDPDFEITNSCHVIFDGKPISIIKYRYIMLHKPPSYVCTSNDKKQKSVLELIKNRSEDRIYHFANILNAPLTGVVLISDDIRWTSRMRLRLQKKPWTYQVRLKHVVQEKQICQLKEICAESGSIPIIERDNRDPNTICLKLNQSQGINIASNLASLNLAIETLQLKQLGRLNLGELKEGDYLELMENEVKI